MNRIKMLREKFKLTQQELADKLSCSKSVIAMYENETRKPSLDVLKSMAEIFDCSIDYLLGFDNVSSIKETNMNIKFDTEINEIKNMLMNKINYDVLLEEIGIKSDDIQSLTPETKAEIKKEVEKIIEAIKKRGN